MKVKFKIVKMTIKVKPDPKYDDLAKRMNDPQDLNDALMVVNAESFIAKWVELIGYKQVALAFEEMKREDNNRPVEATALLDERV